VLTLVNIELLANHLGHAAFLFQQSYTLHYTQKALAGKCHQLSGQGLCKLQEEPVFTPTIQGKAVDVPSLVIMLSVEVLFPLAS
jgi:hypothetical protein